MKLSGIFALNREIIKYSFGTIGDASRFFKIVVFVVLNNGNLTRFL